MDQTLLLIYVCVVLYIVVVFSTKMCEEKNTKRNETNESMMNDGVIN